MRVVLIEPSRAVQRIMTHMMVEAGHDVLAFSHGRDGLDCLKADQSVSGLITSVHLADMSGIQVCTLARALVDTAQPLYVMVMSSTEHYSFAVQALDHGADDFIRKPPYREELLARLRAADRLTSAQRQLVALANTDPLTGLLNRRAFFMQVQNMFSQAEKGSPLSAVMFDIDHFKNVNDTHGHEAGDMVLARLGELAKGTGKTDGRLGGEEFCIVDLCDVEDAVEFAEALRRSIACAPFPCPGGTLAVTASFGTAEREPGDSIDTLLRRADIALYQAKKAGRNRVVASDTFAFTDDHASWRGAARAGTRKHG